MLRLVVFFALAVVLASVLGHLPFVGPLFRHTGLFGIFLSALVLSSVFTRVGAAFLSGRKLRSEITRLAAVDSAHNQGKLGALYLAHGRARAALEPLERAVMGDPDVAEWSYRLGLACLATGRTAEGLEALERCVAIEEEYAYGAAQMARARALHTLGRLDEALEALATLERNHGPSPESSYRRARALARLGRRDESRAAYQEVGRLASRATRYQRRSAAGWALRAGVARFF